MTRRSKLRFALIAGVLLFASSARSAVDYYCSASAVPTLVRAESLAEFVGDVRLACAGTIPNPTAPLVVNIRMTLSTNITSHILQLGPYGVTEAAMVLNGGLPSGFKGYSSVSPLTWYTDGSQNVYQAVRISDTEVEWQGVMLAAPGGDPISEILLTNVRANASAVGTNAPISATINLTSPTSVVINNNSPVVANTRRGAVVSVPSGTEELCNGTSESFTLRFVEGFNNAFRPVGDADVDNTTPGGGYGNESGFNPTPLVEGSLVVGQASIGQATQGTRLLAEFAGVNKPLELSVPNLIDDGHGMSLALVTGHDSNGAGGSLMTGPGTTVLPVSKRGRMAVYEVTGCDMMCAALQNQVDVPVTVAREHGPINKGVLNQLTVKGGLAPLSTVTTASVSAPMPVFVDSGTEIDLSCRSK
jgi:hypothetical protein